MNWELFTDNHKPLRDGVLEGVELIIGYKFPEDYKSCIRLYHTGQPKNDELTIQVDGQPWNIGFGELITPDPMVNDCNIIESTVNLRKIHNSPSWYIPIVEGGAGDKLCLDYSNDTYNPKIVFWFHELEIPESIYPVSNSFSELLSMLMEPD